MLPPQAPVAKRDPKEITQLGRTRIDPYHWLKDENWRNVLTDPDSLRADIKEYLVQENLYTDHVLRETQEIRDVLFEEMKGRISENEDSVPFIRGDYLLNRRYVEGAQYPMHMRMRRDLTALDPLTPLKDENGDVSSSEILLDENLRAAGKSYYRLYAASVTRNQRYYVFSEDFQGSEIYTISFKNLEDGTFLEPIEETTGDFVVTPNDEFVFWIERDSEGRPRKIFRRSLEGGERTLVFEEPNTGYFLHLALTSSERFILIERGDHETNETLLIDLKNPTAAPYSAIPEKAGERYYLHHQNDRFFIMTNRDGRDDFAVFVAPQDDLSAWRELVPHRPGRFITGFTQSKNRIVWGERDNGNVNLFSLDNAQIERLLESSGEARLSDLEKLARRVNENSGEAYDVDLVGFLRYDMDWVRFTYQTPSEPAHCFDTDLSKNEKPVLRKIRQVPSGFDPDRYAVRRLYATAPDGCEIPITLLTLKTRTPAGGPLLLYGYGSYGISIDASFASNCFSLVDRGWAYAIAHIRGGSEKGRNWFEQARKGKKQNTFTDFIACARYLCETHWSAPKRIVAQGGSAGGLLMGAVANQAPELFSGIIAQVPFVDTLNTMSDADLPLTPPEWPEWGNPLTDEKAYDAIAAYSPYDNVAKRDYPPILAMGGLTDPRVTYWEPAKWIARLRAEGSGGPFLCQINMEAGHGGDSGRFGRLKEIALIYAFALACESVASQTEIPLKPLEPSAH